MSARARAIDANLAYWTLAFADLLAAVACAIAGVRRIRAGQVRAHRRRMLAMLSLVGLFLVSYVFKVGILGREDRSLWTAADRAFLYIHETCIAVMLLAAGFALNRAWRFRSSLGPDAVRPLPARAVAQRAQHRIGGRLAALAAILALLSAALVLAGMYARAGILGS